MLGGEHDVTKEDYKKEWMLEEYRSLRAEIADKIRLQNDLLLGAVTASIAVLALVANPAISVYATIIGKPNFEWPPTSTWLYLLPLLVLYPFALRIEYYRSVVGRLSAYIAVFIESELATAEEGFPGWETRNSLHQHKGPTLSEIIGLERGDYVRKGNELSILGCFYFALLLVQILKALVKLYEQRQEEALWLVLGKAGSLLVLALVGLIVLCIIFVHSPARRTMKDTRAFWIKRWTAIREGRYGTDVEDAEGAVDAAEPGDLGKAVKRVCRVINRLGGLIGLQGDKG